MPAMRGLLWEQWRQSRFWILGTCAFLILLTGLVALKRPWLLWAVDQNVAALDTLVWVVGFTLLGLLFGNEGPGDITLHFPGRLFALPCRTSTLVASQLLYKSAVAVLVGGLVAIYRWMLLDQDLPSPQPIILFLGLVSGVQGLILLAAVRGARSALRWGALAGGAGLALIYGLQAVFHLSEDGAASVTVVAIAGLGWLVSLACGPGARQGGHIGSDVAYRWGTVGSRFLPGTELRHRAFSSPAWANCWYEWRRGVIWVPRVLLPATGIWMLGTLGANPSYWTALSADIAIAATAVTVIGCTYCLLRVSPRERHFRLTRPGGEKAVADGKLLAAGLASLLVGGAAMVAGLIGLLVFVASSPHPFSTSRIPEYVWTLFLLGAGIWIALTSTPFYLIGMVTAVALFGLLYALVVPIGALVELGVRDNVAVMLWIFAVTALIFSLWRGLRARQLPMPWEAGLGLLAFGPDVVRMHFEVDLDFPIQIGDQISLRLPFFLLLGGLLFARRARLISWRRLGIALLGDVVISALFLIPIENYIRLGVFTNSDYIFFLIAACFAPVVWVPLALRMQYYR